MPVDIKVTDVGRDCAVFKLEDLAMSADADKPAYAQAIDRFSPWFVGAVLLVAGLTSVYWFHHDSDKLFLSAVAVLVAACPCALSLATPVTISSSHNLLRRMGIVPKSSALLERLPAINRIVFDKTGTLTQDLPELTEDDSLSRLNHDQFRMLANLCAKSRHPLSRSLLKSMGLKGQQVIEPTLKVSEVPGLGSWLTDSSGTRWSLGKCGWSGMDNRQIKATSGGCQLRENGKEVARFTFAESLRPETALTISQLADRDVYVLSGDQQERVQHISKVVGVTEGHVHAGLSPEDKARIVSQIDSEQSLFLGDGANDSLAFDAANMSGAVAGRGLLEAKSDFYFLSSGLRFLPEMFRMADSYHTTVRSVFMFSILYNLSAVAVCLTGHMNPLLAAILMPLSSVISLAIVAGTLVRNRCSTI